MITLKSGSYTENDFTALYRILDCGKNYFCGKYGQYPEKNCSNCDYRLACSELESLKEYAREKVCEKKVNRIGIVQIDF